MGPLLDDLEINESVLPKPRTQAGRRMMGVILNKHLVNMIDLEKRQKLLRAILQNPSISQQLDELCQKVAELEGEIDWLGTEDKYYRPLYFHYRVLNYKCLLAARNYFSIAGPFMMPLIHVTCYMVLRYWGFDFSITDYAKRSYLTYISMVTAVLLLVTGKEGLAKEGSKFLVWLYILFMGYLMYDSFRKAYDHYLKCQELKQHIGKIGQLVKLVKQIRLLDIYFVAHHNKIGVSLDGCSFNNCHLGRCLEIWENRELHKSQLGALMDYVGLVDVFMSIVRHYRDEGWCFPVFMKSDQPELKVVKAWHPRIAKVQRVTNSVALGEPNTIILTGPNASGKSTFMKSMMLAVFFAQTLGVSCCKQISLTPFVYLNTYLNIPDQVGRESLFEAEMNRCYQYYKSLSELPDQLFSLTIIDELFTGTNALEGVSGSYAICEHLAKFKNSLQIVSTHFNHLTKLEDRYPEKIHNYKTLIFKLDDGTIIHPYVVQRGVSNQTIALELLAQKGYEGSIIDSAQQVMEELIQREEQMNEKAT